MKYWGCLFWMELPQQMTLELCKYSDSGALSFLSATEGRGEGDTFAETFLRGPHRESERILRQSQTRPQCAVLQRLQPPLLLPVCSLATGWCAPAIVSPEPLHPLHTLAPQTRR